jgi:NAD(P)H-dependent FMN reductase
MPEKTRLLAFAGSLRTESFNQRLINLLADEARKAGAEVTLITLRDYPLPIYNGDVEAQGMPENVRRLQALLADHQGLLISSPEYNGGVPALVKNTLDWISRPLQDGRPGMSLFKGKVAGISSASPGALGGLRGLIALRDMLAKFSLWVAPTQIAIAQAGSAFTDQDTLSNPDHQATLVQLAAEVVELTHR